MIASLFSIRTDEDGESKITFRVPSSELINVVKLNAMLRKELDIDIKEPEFCKTKEYITDGTTEGQDEQP